jgi:hypothetical protein
MRTLITLLLVSLTLLSNAQNRCGTEEYTRSLIEKYPEYAKEKEKTNAQTKRWIKNHPNHNEKTIITIPVVVHVVWNTNSENISDEQIFSQIEVLNKDFRRTNIDSFMTPSVWKNIAADSEIEFCLAQTDANGNNTTGITRTETAETSFSMNDDVKHTSTGGIDAWANDEYLNIWVCDLGSGLLGYATQPWGNNINDEDGVVIGYDCFGSTGTAQPPYHKGRTATHEVGHWLNLDHLWGNNNCGNDGVPDTPKQKEDNYSCPGFPSISTCDDPQGNPTPNSPNGDMFMNYMDYTNDGCMNLFTNGQKDRMITTLNTKRSNLLNHTLCEGGVSAITESINQRKELVEIVDVLGRTTSDKATNTPLFYIYNDGTVEKKIIIE